MTKKKVGFGGVVGPEDYKPEVKSKPTDEEIERELMKNPEYQKAMGAREMYKALHNNDKRTMFENMNNYQKIGGALFLLALLIFIYETLYGYTPNKATEFFGVLILGFMFMFEGNRVR